jgi:hypothetical protein
LWWIIWLHLPAYSGLKSGIIFAIETLHLVCFDELVALSVEFQLNKGFICLLCWTCYTFRTSRVFTAAVQMCYCFRILNIAFIPQHY